MDSGFLIGRVRGIDLRVNWSVLLIAVLLTWSLAESLLPDFAAGYQSAEYWTVATVAAIGFLAGLLAHELGHSLVAVRAGVGVRSISLWLLGGLASLDGEPPDPRAAMRIALAGPAVSFAIGAGALIVAVVTGGLVGAAFAWYGFINVALAVFNLLPAFPMDGGRVYQAWQWERSGDRVEATRRAAALGRGFGTFLIALGVVEVLAAGAIGGIWMTLIGWFVREAAAAELQSVEVGAPLRALSVRDVMTPSPATVRADVSVDGFVRGLFYGGRHAAYPVVDPAGAVVGLLGLNDVRALDRDLWAATPVGRIAVPLDRVLVVAPDTSVAELLEAMAGRREQRALVVGDGRLVGIVARATSPGSSRSSR